MELFGGEYREPVVQVKAHLMAEDADRPGAGPVFLFRPIL